MEIELKNRKLIRLDNKSRYLFNRYMVTIIERSGRTVEREYRLVNRNNLDYIVLDGLYYRIFATEDTLSIELGEGKIELMDERVYEESFISRG